MMDNFTKISLYLTIAFAIISVITYIIESATEIVVFPIFMTLTGFFFVSAMLSIVDLGEEELIMDMPRCNNCPLKNRTKCQTGSILGEDD